MNDLAPLSRGWRGLFLVELPLTLGTVVYWLVAPARYLRDVLGLASLEDGSVMLLQLYAGTTASLVVLFYGWLLTRPAVHRPTFRAFQACLAAGDLAIVGVSVLHWQTAPQRAPLALQLGMAALWLGLRVAWWRSDVRVASVARA